MFTANMLKIKQNELIISEMFHQDVLWNKKHKKYRNKSYTTKAWTTVATKIGMNEMELKKRWKNLRDNYNTERKKYLMRSKKYHSKWKHYTAMQFLKDMFVMVATRVNRIKYAYDTYVTPSVTLAHLERTVAVKTFMTKKTQGSKIAETSTSRNTRSESAIQIPLQLNNNSNTTRPYEVNLGQNVSIIDIESEQFKTLQLTEPVEIDNSDEDMFFLRSMLPYFVNMSPIQKLKIRSQIQNIFIKELSILLPTAASAAASAATQSQNTFYSPSFIFHPYQIYPTQSVEFNPFTMI